MATRSGLGVSLVIAGLLLAACSSGSDNSDANTTPPPDSATADVSSSEPPAAPDDDVADEAAPASTDADAETVADADELDSGSSFVPGDIEYRAVNLTDEPVDLYVRTSGLVEAFLVEEGFAPGAVSDFVAPPDDQGRFLVTTSGAGDATCVVDCDHIIAELTASPDEGPVRTVLIHPGDGGASTAFEFWELPTEDAFASGNAMIAADPAKTLAAISAVAIVEPDFGYRVTIDGAEGCLADVNDSDLLIGGNQIIPYDFVNATEFTLHAFDDQDCSQDPVGGPFPFEGLSGDRFHVMMYGTPGALEAFVLQMVDGATDADTAPAAEPADTAAPSVDDSADRDEAIDLMAAEVTATFGLADPEASCVATLLVDRIGADVLVVDGALVDLDSFPEDVNQLAGEALVASVAECGIDPSVFG